MSPAARSDQALVLGGIIEEASKAAGSLVVFDLDDTLFSTSQRHLRILAEFTALPEILSRYSPHALILAGLGPERLLYSIVETVRAAGVADDAFLKELRSFWFERFFANEYIRHDAPTAGAVEYCKAVLAAGARVVYLTGRDVNMRDGTLAALKANGFPAPDDKDVSLILKPRFDMDDASYKDEAIRRVGRMGRVAGSFDNEPVLVNLFHAAFPEGRTVFVDTRHSGKPVLPHPEIPWIKDFSRNGKC